MDIQLSVIIVNYNGIQFLENCLNSLKERLKTINYEIIIIDNNSSDNSCVFLKQNFPEVVLIESKINYGFGKGNNEAVKYAKGKYLLLFNNDTILLDDISPAITLLEEEPSIGVIGINMLDKNKSYLPVAGTFPNLSNMLRFRKLYDCRKDFVDGNFILESYEVDWLGGSFLLLKKDTYRDINGFDEDYFMYVEDVDFCKKIANKNLKRIFLSNLNYIHFVGFNKQKNSALVKGYRIYLKKHHNGLMFVMISLMLTINSVIKKMKSLY